MGDLTTHFNHADWECPCCGLNRPHPLAVCGVDQVRKRLGAPVWVTSGSRCEPHNDLVGGRPGSKHLQHEHGLTLATDIVVPGVRLLRVLNAAEMIEQFRDGGIGLYLNGVKRFAHLDVRRERARWCYLDGHMVDVSTLLAEDATRDLEDDYA